MSISFVRAEWKDPDWAAGAGQAPTGGTTTAPLNTSGIPQTIIGNFTIENTLDVLASGIQTSETRPLTVQQNLRVTPDPEVGGAICINDPGDGSLCRSTFNFEEGNFVHINPSTPDLGFIILGDDDPATVGYLIVDGDQSESLSPIALYAKAGQSTLDITHGLLGYAGSGDTVSGFISAGVYGEAGSNDALSVGIGGIAPTLAGPAYAAYFKGNVEIEGCLDFAGECLSAWPGGPIDGNFVKLLGASDPNQLGNIDLNENSTSAFNSLILGGEPSGLGMDITCGDGSCNNGETVFSCVVDCFVIYSVAPQNITDGTAIITWGTTIAANSVVRYGTTPDLGSEIVDDAPVNSHAILLSSLQHDDTYYFEVQSVANTGASRISNTFNFETLIDTTPSFPSANLHTVGPKPDRMPIAWYHNLQDDPGGSGFSHFAIYRDGMPYVTTADSWYIDYFVDEDAYYTYEITAVDSLGNESEPTNTEIYHVPTSCTSDLQCTNPLYPKCYGEFGCGPAQGGSPVIMKGGSPVIMKSQVVQYDGGYEGGGGW